MQTIRANERHKASKSWQFQFKSNFKDNVYVPSLKNRRRRSELGMIILAELIASLTWLLAKVGLDSTMPTHVPLSAIWLLVLPLLCHLALHVFAPNADPTALPIISFLNAFGYVLIQRLDPAEATLQSLWSAVGVLGFVLTLALIPKIEILDKYRYLLMLGGVVLLLLPLAPVIGENINGARLWIHLGQLSFQPVEAAKIMLAIFFASYMTEKREVLSDFSPFHIRKASGALRAGGPILVAWAISLLIMTAERDVGFSLLIFLVFIFALWIATSNSWYLIFGSILFSVGAFVASKLFSQVGERITTWLDPWKYSLTIGYQLVQAQYAFGSGGISGTGLGHGHPGLIPVVTSDFIFAAIGEEMGLLGTTAILFLFILLVGFGLKAARRADSQFASLCGAALSLTLGLQAFFIMAGVTRLLPLTGVTLPFVAYGGSSLVANYVLIALLLRISDQSNKRASPHLTPRTRIKAS